MKQIMAIHRQGVTFVDQAVLQRNCEHEHQMVHNIKGVTPQDNDYEIICLDCGKRIDYPDDGLVNLESTANH